MAKIRIHKETYEALCRYAAETGFYDPLQDWLEEQGVRLEVKKVAIDNRDEFRGTFDVNCYMKDCLWIEQSEMWMCFYRLASTKRSALLNARNGYYEGEIDDLS